jgi:hypothetical protein
MAFDWTTRAGMEQVVTDEDDARELQQLPHKGWVEATAALTDAIRDVVAERGISNYDAQRLLRTISDEIRISFVPCYSCRKVHSGQMPCDRSVIEQRFGGAR